MMKAPVLIDLRNVYGPKAMADAGFDYTSVGRPRSDSGAIGQASRNDES